MSEDESHASGRVDPGDTSERADAEVVRERGVGAEGRREKPVDAIGRLGR